MLRKILLPLLVAMTLAACGGSQPISAISGVPSTVASAATAAPTTTAPAMTEAVQDGPTRIVSISTVATEILFAIGAGDKVVAVDSLSTFPAEAPVTDLNGFEPNVEAILGFRPDLVILSYDPGDVVAGLEAAGVEAMLQEASMTIADTYVQILALGEITVHAAEAAVLADAMQAEMSDLAVSVTERDEPLSYYHELDDTLYTVTSSTFIGEVYAMAGLVNVADPADADGSSWGYPQLSSEYLLDADPDIIFLADTKCCAQTAATIAERPGWETLTAVSTGRIVELDDDVASRWGPRILDFLRAIVDAVNSVD
ncbi:MAG: ABC transporter substrate-binding protein [Actinomycetota bacterium]|nr:ABC transporter substrate-binding protein [Actinomycetota bacterium]